MIRQAVFTDIIYVTHRVRDIDWREISPLLWADDKDDLINSTWESCKDTAWVAVNKEDEPVAIFGGNLTTPGVAVIWLWATDKISKKNWREITRWGLRSMKSVASKNIVHRFQAMVADFNTEAQRWIACCGMKDRALMPAMGKNKENYILMSRFE